MLTRIPYPAAVHWSGSFARSAPGTRAPVEATGRGLFLLQASQPTKRRAARSMALPGKPSGVTRRYVGARSTAWMTVRPLSVMDVCLRVAISGRPQRERERPPEQYAVA
jgi:hypothetical protein